MYKPLFNRRKPLRFKHFSNKGFSLFNVLGKEVIVGVLSVSTLTYAKADGVSTDISRVTEDSALNKETIELDEVNVTGSRAPLSLTRQARMVSVLGREDIEALPAESVNDLLKYAVGVDVRQRGPLGAQTDISIRGGKYEQIAVLLNGINICDPQTGHNSMDLPVSISDIERIEIIEGPSGRVYGTSSLIGAINIITRRNGTEGLVGAGSYGFFLASGKYSSMKNNSRARSAHSLSATYMRDDGYSRNKAGTLNADYKTGKAFYQGSFSDNDIFASWYTGASVKDFGSNTFYGFAWDDQFEHTFRTFTAIKAENRQGKVRLKPALYWNHGEDRFELFRGRPDLYPFNYHRYDVFGLNINAYFDWKWGRTALGGEIRNEDLVSTNLGETLSKAKHIHGTDLFYEYGLNRTNIQFVIEHNVALGRLNISAGLIAVKNTWAEMNTRVYPAVDISLKATRRLRLYANYNSSLRMPSATELYYSVGGHMADKHLQPEELDALEGGVKYASAAVKGRLSVYYHHNKNLIDWIYNTKSDSAVWQSKNFGVINSVGVEAEAAVDTRRLWRGQNIVTVFSIAWSHINQDKKEEEGWQSQNALEYLRDKIVARLSLTPLATLDTPPFSTLKADIGWRLMKRAGTYTDTDGQINPYSAYSLLDLKLSLPAGHWLFYLEGDNLLNREYRDFGAVAQPGFCFSAGARFRL